MLTLLLAAMLATDLPPVVYLPTDQIGVADPSGRSVLLPYERFVALWEAGRPVPAPPPGPPVPATLRSYTATVSGPVASGTLVMDVVAHGAHWPVLVLGDDLPLASISCSDARVATDRVPGRTVVSAVGDTWASVATLNRTTVETLRATNGWHAGELPMGCRIIVPDAAATTVRLILPTAGTYQVTAGIALAVSTGIDGRRSLTAALPQAAAGRVRLDLGEGAKAVDAGGAAAATTATDAGTEVRIVTGGSPRLRLGWDAAAAVSAEPPLLHASGDHTVTVGDRRIAWRSRIAATVLRSALATMTVELPDEAQVVGIQAPGLADWSVAGTALTVRFHQGVLGEVPLELGLERALAADTAATSIPLPLLATAQRQTARLVVVADAGMAVEVEPGTGWAQIDPGDETPAAVGAWRSTAAPAPVTAALTRLAAEIRSTIAERLRLGAQEDAAWVRIDLDVRRAGIFDVACTWDAGWSLVDATGIDGVVIDEQQPAPQAAGRDGVRLVLRNRVLGSAAVILDLRRPGSLSGSAAGTLEHRPVRVVGAHRQRGTLACAAPASWDLTAELRPGHASADRDALRQDPPWALGPDEDLAVALTWLGADAGAVALSATPRSGDVALTQEDLIVVGDGGIRRTVTWRATARWRPVAVVRVQAPTAWDDAFRFTGDGLGERVAVERQDGRTIWELRLQQPVLGTIVLGAEHDLPLPTLVPGRSAEVVLPVVSWIGAQRSTAVTALIHEGDLTATLQAPGTEPMEAVDLPAGLHRPGLAAAVRGLATDTLRLGVTRQDLAPMATAAATVVEHLVAAGADGLVRTRTRVVLTSRTPGAVAIRLPANATLLEAALDNVTARPTRRTDGCLVIPLPRPGPHRLALVSERSGPAVAGLWTRTALDLPLIEMDGGLVVDRTQVAVHLPEDREILGWVGGFGHANETLDLGNAADGLTVRLDPIGSPTVVQRIGSDPVLAVVSVHARLQSVLCLLAGVVGVALAWILRRRPALVVAGLGAVAVAGAVAAPWWLVIAGCAVAGLLAGLVAAAVAGRRRA
jgi:hypothetical protein